MKNVLNAGIKRREPLRPFAPSILEERTAETPPRCTRSFALQVYPIRPAKRAEIPAVTHVDGSGRLHTVSRRPSPRDSRLIETF